MWETLTSLSFLVQLAAQEMWYDLGEAHTGKATKGKVQDIGEVNKVMPLPQPSSVG